MVASGDLTIVKTLSGGTRAVLPYTAPTASGALAVPVLLANGARALMAVEAADAEDDLAFPVILAGGRRALVRAVATPSPVTCGTCSPAISEVFTATFSGLAGDFAAYNGAQTLTWFGLAAPCFWTTPGYGASGPGVELFTASPGSDPMAWDLIIVVNASCYLWFTKTVTRCNDPVGSYAYSVSSECSGCVDPASCANSAAAIAVVS